MEKNNAPLSAAEAALRDAALDYHRSPTRGKISVTPTKALSNQRDLSLAYSPGVAYPCLDIERDPALAQVRMIILSAHHQISPSFYRAEAQRRHGRRKGGA